LREFLTARKGTETERKEKLSRSSKGIKIKLKNIKMGHRE